MRSHNFDPSRIPAGWKLVPIVPTTAMRAALARACTLGWDIGDHCWERALAASPSLPESPPASVETQTEGGRT